MDTRDGKIVADLDGVPELERLFFRRMLLAPTAKQLRRKPARVGRNDPCPCGSGLKFKRCCMR
jgi:uncharacterized protein YecA (UPF0149 family)